MGDLAARFWSKVDKDGPVHPLLGTSCWLWRASVNPHNGYGRIHVGGKFGTVLLAHRVAFVLSRGEIPAGLRVLHRCDNPRCCNPDHFMLGTQLDNVHDAIRKGRHSIVGLVAYNEARRTA